jgi:hypothetical protein
MKEKEFYAEVAESTEDAEKKKQIPRFAPFAPPGKRNDS